VAVVVVTLVVDAGTTQIISVLIMGSVDAPMIKVDMAVEMEYMLAAMLAETTKETTRSMVVVTY
jgi:hypothetical protein